jgi:hypothetical protein
MNQTREAVKMERLEEATNPQTTETMTVPTMINTAVGTQDRIIAEAIVTTKFRTANLTLTTLVVEEEEEGGATILQAGH